MLGKVEIKGDSGNSIDSTLVQRSGRPGVRSNKKEKLEDRKFLSRRKRGNSLGLSCSSKGEVGLNFFLCLSLCYEDM